MSTQPIKLVADSAGFQENMRAAAQATRELILSEKDLAIALAVARGAGEEKERLLKAMGVSSKEYADAQRLLRTQVVNNTEAFKGNKASMKDAVEMLENATGTSTGLGAVIRQAATPALLGMAVAAVAIGQATEWWISGESKLHALVQATNAEILGKAAALEKARDRGAKLSDAQERIIENAERIKALKMADEWREQTQQIINAEMRMSIMEGTLSILEMASQAVGLALKGMAIALFGTAEASARLFGKTEMADKIHGWRVAFVENFNVAGRAADLLREKLMRTREEQQALLNGISLAAGGGKVPEAPGGKPRPGGKSGDGGAAGQIETLLANWKKFEDSLTAIKRAGEQARKNVADQFASMSKAIGVAAEKQASLAEALKTRHDRARRNKEFADERAHQRRIMQLHGASAAQIRSYDRETAQIRAQLFAQDVANANTHAQNIFAVAGTAFGKHKGIAIASAIMNTAQGATKAYADWGFPMGIIAAAAVIAGGIAQIQQIRSAKPDSGQAHGGQDNTRSGSYNLIAGEMVLDPLAGSTGRALVDMARRGADKPVQRSSGVTLNFNGPVYGGRAGVKQLAKAVKSAGAYGVR